MKKHDRSRRSDARSTPREARWNARTPRRCRREGRTSRIERPRARSGTSSSRYGGGTRSRLIFPSSSRFAVRQKPPRLRVRRANRPASRAPAEGWRSPSASSEARSTGFLRSTVSFPRSTLRPNLRRTFSVFPESARAFAAANAERRRRAMKMGGGGGDGGRDAEGSAEDSAEESNADKLSNADASREEEEDSSRRGRTARGEVGAPSPSEGTLRRRSARRGRRSPRGAAEGRRRRRTRGRRRGD